MAKYSLGNQSEEYELVTDYVGWIPFPYDNWDEFIDANNDIIYPHEILITSPDQKEGRLILIHQNIFSKAVFPISTYSELKYWERFWIISTVINPETKFIIPAH